MTPRRFFRFGVTAVYVRKLLKLAKVSPTLFAAYREGDMTLEQLMAFTVANDNDQREKVWAALTAWNRHPNTIRHALTVDAVPAIDKRVKLIGIAAYEQAGGTVQRDLFDTEDGGYLTDPLLLDQLVTERLTQEAERLTQEGWAWATISSNIEYQTLQAFTRTYPDTVALSDKDQAALDAAIEAYDALAEQHDEEPEYEAVKAEIERLSDYIDWLMAKQQQYSDTIKATHGCVVGVQWDGTIHIVAGLAERQDEPATAAPANDESGSDEATPGQTKLAPKLIAELIAHRTAVIRAEILDRRPSPLSCPCIGWRYNIFINMAVSQALVFTLAMKTYLRAIQAHPDIVGIGDTDGDSGKGAAIAVHEAGGPGDIKIVAMDRNDDVLPYIEDGTITGAVAQKSYLEIFLAFHMMHWQNTGALKVLPDWRANAIRLLVSMWYCHGSTKFPRGWVTPAMQEFLDRGLDCPKAWRLMIGSYGLPKALFCGSS